MSARPRARQERLLVRPLGDEWLVYDLDRHSAVCLNPSAAAVWRRCDGRADVSGIARAVSAEVGARFDEDAVWCALDGLEKQGLLEPLASASERPRRTRREWLRELGRSGLGAALVPTVLAVLAPSPAQALSYITKAECESRTPGACGGQACTKGGHCLTVVKGKTARCRCV
jgi:hypothetical protein